MPFKLFLCLGSNKRNPRRNKKLAKLVKVHTDETTSIKLSSAGSSVLSLRSFVPSVSLNLKDFPTPPREDSKNKDDSDNLIEKQTLSLTSNTDVEIDTTPKQVIPPFEDPLSNEDHLPNKDHPIIEESPSVEDIPPNGDNPSVKDNLFDEDEKLMEDSIFDEAQIPKKDTSPNEDHTPSEDFSTEKDPPPSEEDLLTESSMNASLDSSSSVENEYAQLVCSAVQNSLSEEKQNELLNGVNSNESYLSPLIENLEDASSSSKTTLASPTIFISAEDVKIISGIDSPSEFAEILSLSMSVKEEHAEMIEVEWKSSIKVEPIKIEPVEIVEHDNSADYLESEYDAWVPGQPFDDLNILDLSEYEKFFEEFELKDNAIYYDAHNETADYLELDDDVPGQPTEELKILLTRYDKLNEKIEPEDETSNNDAHDKTPFYLELEDNSCVPGTPKEDINILLTGYEEFNEKLTSVDEATNNNAHDGTAAYLELEDDTCVPSLPTDDLKILLTRCEEVYKKLEPEDEASNDDFQNEYDFGLFKHPTKEIPNRLCEVSFDTNLSAGDSMTPTSELQSQTIENLDQKDSSKVKGSEQVFKEDMDVLCKSLTEDYDYAEPENPIDWCGDFAGSVFDSENDKKSVSSDRSETEMAEINDLIWGNEEMNTEFPISRKSQLRISDRQRKFRNVLQNLIDAQSSQEFQSVFNVKVFREETMGGDSDEKKVFCSEVNDSTDAQFSLKENPSSDGNFQSRNDNQNTEMQSHCVSNDKNLKENVKKDIIEETKSCDQILNEMVETNTLSLTDEERVDESPKAENAHVVVSKWRKKFRNALHKLIDMKNSAQNQSTSNLNVLTEETDTEKNYESGNKNVTFFEVKDYNDKHFSSKEDINPERNFCSQNENPPTEKRSHSILNEEALQLLEESKKKDRTDSSVDSDLSEDKDCFKFKRARISETKKQTATPKRKVIDQVIESTQKYSSPNYNTQNKTQNHSSKSESSVEFKGGVENQDNLNSVFTTDQNYDSLCYNNFISQNKLKNAIERFVKKAEEYNQMLCNEQIAVSSMKDFADKITQMEIDQATPRIRNTCADKLIKQFINKQDGNESCNLKENSKTCDLQTEQRADGTDGIMLASYSVDSSDSTQEESVNNDNGEVSKSGDVSCSPSMNIIGPDEQKSGIEQTKRESPLSVKSSNNDFTLNLNHRNGKRSFECSGDFTLSRGDIDDASNAPPPLTIHLKSKRNSSKNHHSPTKQSADSKTKTIDEKYKNLEPKVMEERKKSQSVFDHFMKEALEPLGPNRRIIQIKRTGSLPFIFGALENEMTIPSNKNGNRPKLQNLVLPLHSRTSKGKHDRHSPKHVDSPTIFRTGLRHSNTNILLGAERTSIAKRFLEASNAFKYWRSSLAGDEDLNAFDLSVSKPSGGYAGQRGSNLKMKQLEMLQKRYDVKKNKRDIEKIERIEKFVDFSSIQPKPTKGNTSADYFGEVFDGKFKRYARKASSSGDLISYKRSTDWLTDAGIVGQLLTADEANKIFKRIAGVKVTLNKQDYKRFLYKLTRLKRISYNEICERLCRCADFSA